MSSDVANDNCTEWVWFSLVWFVLAVAVFVPAGQWQCTQLDIHYKNGSTRTVTEDKWTCTCTCGSLFLSGLLALFLILYPILNVSVCGFYLVACFISASKKSLMLQNGSSLYLDYMYVYTRTYLNISTLFIYVFICIWFFSSF